MTVDMTSEEFEALLTLADRELRKRKNRAPMVSIGGFHPDNPPTAALRAARDKLASLQAEAEKITKEDQ